MDAVRSGCAVPQSLRRAPPLEKPPASLVGSVWSGGTDRGGPGARLSQEPSKLLQVGWFGEVGVEPGVLRAFPVLLRAVPRQGDQQHGAGALLRAEPPAEFPAVHP